MKGGRSSQKRSTRPRFLGGGVVALALLVALIAWLAGRDDSSVASNTSAPRIVSAAEFVEAAESSSHLIYWVGEMPRAEVELSELADGGSRVRYVPQGTEAGQGSTGVLTVSSYPLADPAVALEGFAKRPGAIVRQASDGREVVSSRERPTSVYFASPDNSVQVEVYDLSAAKAMSLALSGRVRPAAP